MSRPAFYPFKSEVAKAEFEAYCTEVAKHWPQGTETRLLESESGQTFVRICGRATDQPLVLLSGARSSSLMWTNMIAPLSAHFRCYALDTIGDAGLSVNRRAITNPEDYIAWLDEIFAQLFPQKQISLMGISYGGFIAAQYALRRPERLSGVVLLAPGNTVLMISGGFVIRRLLLSVPLTGVGVSGMMRWLFRDAARGDAASREYLRRVIEYLKMVLRLMSLPLPPWPPVIDDEGWKNLRVPCLFLVGEHEKIYSARKAVERLNRVAPQVRTEIIPGAGHDLTFVKSDLVFSKALSFLVAQIPPGS